ncbi:hypothetical protein BDR03DRAFT_458927 [Suillus americanus]|nr:hypothetical protein BDR03DRAFT_458927 [Suillus americanus]
MAFMASSRLPQTAHFKFKVNAGTTENGRDTGKHEFWGWRGIYSNQHGCGLNVLNTPPIALLAQLALSVERVAAAVLTSLSTYGVLFCRIRNRGFTRSWIDTSDRGYIHQLITLTNRTPHQSVRIVGITPDHDLLRTVSIGRGEFVDLQPDGIALIRTGG